MGLGAAGTRLDVEIGVRLVHFAGEHAAEFERFEFRPQGLEFAFRLPRQADIVFRAGQLEPFAQFPNAGFERVDGAGGRGQIGLFAAQGLGARRLLPNRGLGEFEFHLGQALAFGGIVKDTP